MILLIVTGNPSNRKFRLCCTAENLKNVESEDQFCYLPAFVFLSRSFTTLSLSSYNCEIHCMFQRIIVKSKYEIYESTLKCSISIEEF